MNNTHGGARKGSGRKKDPSKVVGARIKEEWASEFKQLVLELRTKFLKEKSKLKQ